MKTLYKIAQSLFKIYVSLAVLFLLSCGSRNSSNGSYRSTTVSYYADKFDGKKTASGETYRHSKLTASNKTLAFGTRVEIVNIDNDLLKYDKSSLQLEYNKKANTNDKLVFNFIKCTSNGPNIGHFIECAIIK